MKINKKGFTLIELLVVIAIIGLLSTLAVVSLNSARLKARDARRQSDIKQISTALELYNSQNNLGQYPTDGADCTVAGTLANSTTHVLCSGQPIQLGSDVFLSAIPTDPLNTGTNVYMYQTVGSTASYCISARMENPNTNYFQCNNGSCGITAAGHCP